MAYFQSLGLSDYGSWASIISLVVSFITLLMVFSLKKKFMFRSRVEEHQVSLREIASKLSLLFESFDNNMGEIGDALEIAEIKLRNLEKGATDKYLLSNISQARKQINNFGSKPSFLAKFTHSPTKESIARKAYTKINCVVEELDNIKKELVVG